MPRRSMSTDPIIAPVQNRRQLKRRRVGRQPLVHVKRRLGACSVRPRRRHLQIVAVPPVVWARSVGGQVQSTHRRFHACAPSAEYVHVVPFEIVVPLFHQPPRF